MGRRHDGKEKANDWLLSSWQPFVNSALSLLPQRKEMKVQLAVVGFGERFNAHGSLIMGRVSIAPWDASLGAKGRMMILLG